MVACAAFVNLAEAFTPTARALRSPRRANVKIADSR